LRILITNFHLAGRLTAIVYFRPVEMRTWKLDSLNDVHPLAENLLGSFPAGRVFAFFGEMGAGKTTIIKAVCKVLGVAENVSSPTFALVNEYATGHGMPVYHFDFYRIENEQEAVDIGVDEYFTSGNHCFVEWPEKILHLLPEGTLRVHITVKNETRIITMDNG
jgi:tRNA threonylcarbamoyladenosine biosynthesis protein TsaE